MPALDRLLAPRSIAILGASEKPGALGNAVLANLLRHGYAGKIHLINPKGGLVQGRACLASVEALPAGVDVAVLAIPGAAVLTAIRALAARGVGAAVIFAAGFAEGGEAGLAAQRELAGIAATTGMAILGPNCLGLTHFASGLPLTFVEVPLHAASGPGIGIVSQSGAMAVVLGTMLMAKALPLTLSVSTGNEAASGVEDYVAHLAADPATHVIGMVVEQFRDPQRFLALAQAAREAGKAIVLLHPGTSEAARRSAATHTGALAGDHALMRAKVEAAGVILAGTLEELGDLLDLALRCGRPAPGTAVLTESGAFKAMTLDVAETIGLALPPPSGATEAALRAAVPDFIPVSNPMDLTAQSLVDPDIYRRTLIPLLEDPAYGSILLAIIQTDPTTAALKFPPVLEAIRALRPGKPLLVAGLDEGAEMPSDYAAGLRALGVPYFPTPYRAYRALARLAAPRPLAGPVAAPIRVALPGDGMIPEHRAKAALAPHGIPFPAGILAATEDAALAAAETLGWPVALKAQAAALPHKSDAGGVVLGLDGPASLRAGWARMQSDLARHAPGLVLDGVLVERMGARGVELIIGARRDPDWGAVVLAGFGGVQAELLRDVALLVPGLARDAVAAALRTLRAGALFDGWRGSPALDLDAVVELVMTLGRILEGTPAIREIDLNPVVVHPKGQGIVALDALILADPA
jgi:acyl-CoA synthetase (NDP forming)